MDKASKKEPKKPEDDLQEQLQKDFIVKNMPSFSSFSGTNYNLAGKASEKEIKIKGKPENAKSTGLVIIGAGLVAVLAIFFLAYRFLIVPAMKSKTAAVSPTASSAPASVETASPTPPETGTSVVMPVIEATTTASSTASSSQPVVKLNLPTVADTDQDGLSDAAENFLGTNPKLADTDGDGYSDEQEILSGYNPNGAGKLSDSHNFSLYIHPDKLFAAIYPYSWEVSAPTASSTLFSAPDQSFIQISYEDSDQDNTDILAWYRSQFPEDTSLGADRLIESNLGPGVLSADNQIAYFLDSDRKHVFVVSYIKSGDTAPYLEIFKMIASTLMRP